MRSLGRTIAAIGSLVIMGGSLALLSESGARSPAGEGAGLRHAVFVFEGHNGYSLASYVALQALLARGMDCSQADGRVHFNDGATASVDELRDRSYNLHGADGSPNALNGFVYDGLCRSARLDLRDTAIFYYDGDGDLDGALARASELERSGPVALAAVGHSHGGALAVEFGNSLSARGITLDLGISVDPVPRTWSEDFSIALSFLALGGEGSDSDLRAPDGTRWINYWQTSDNRWGDFVRGHYGLHGVSVANAALNREIVPAVDPQQSQPNGAHWRILVEPGVQARIGAELRGFYGL